MEYCNPNIYEIYYLKIISTQSKNSDDAYKNGPEIVLLKDIPPLLKKIGYDLDNRRGYDKYEFAINNLLIVSFKSDSKNKWLKYTILNGCFAAFEKNLEFCFKFLKDFNDKVYEIQLLDIWETRINVNFNTKENFINTMKAHFNEKYHQFIERFGQIDELVMADEDFYDLYYAKYQNRK